MSDEDLELLNSGNAKSIIYCNGDLSVSGTLTFDIPDCEINYPHCSHEPAFDLCPCGSMVASDAHRQFTFYRSAADIAAVYHEEWRPCPERKEIPGEQGPSRVAYQWEDGTPVVQVHEGDDAGLWTACYSYTITLDGLPFCTWVCRRNHVTNPCDEDFMRGISS